MTKSNKLENLRSYKKLLKKVNDLIFKHKKNFAITIHQMILELYWETGKMIVIHLQQGKEKAKYSEKIIELLSYDLKLSGQKGFSINNLKNMRLFY